jgi:hypothetical protein
MLPDLAVDLMVVAPLPRKELPSYSDMCSNSYDVNHKGLVRCPKRLEGGIMLSSKRGICPIPEGGPKIEALPYVNHVMPPF